MSEAEAIEVLRQYAAEWGVNSINIKRVDIKKKGWWRFSRGVEFSIRFNNESGSGTAIVDNYPYHQGVYIFCVEPNDDGILMLPPWAAFPAYQSFSSGWGHGFGAHYGIKWGKWYQSLSSHEQLDYQRHFPEPDDELRQWQGFYKTQES